MLCHLIKEKGSYSRGTKLHKLDILTHNSTLFLGKSENVCSFVHLRFGQV